MCVCVVRSPTPTPVHRLAPHTQTKRLRSVVAGNAPAGLLGDRPGRDTAANLQLARTDGATMTWDHAWEIISSRTGIIEPDIFFQRLNNGGVLEEQINTLKKTSEQRLEHLKKEVVAVEQDLEESRNMATFAAGPSNKDKIMEVRVSVSVYVHRVCCLVFTLTHCVCPVP